MQYQNLTNTPKLRRTPADLVGVWLWSSGASAAGTMLYIAVVVISHSTKRLDSMIEFSLMGVIFIPFLYVCLLAITMFVMLPSVGAIGAAHALLTQGLKAGFGKAVRLTGMALLGGGVAYATGVGLLALTSMMDKPILTPFLFCFALGGVVGGGMLERLNARNP